MSWTPAKIKNLKNLWKRGKTTGEIGRALGMSKGAVVGKVHRLELEGRPSPIIKKTESNKGSSKKTPAKKTEKKTVSKNTPTKKTKTPPMTTKKSPVKETKKPDKKAAVKGAKKGKTSDKEVSLKGKKEVAKKGASKPVAEKKATDKKVETKKAATKKEVVKKEPAKKNEPAQKPEKGSVKVADKPVVEPETDEEIVPEKPKEIKTTNVSLMELKLTSCRWPIGDPKDPDFHFCGNQTQTGKSYCPDHCKMAYISLRELNQQNAKNQKGKDSKK